MLKHNLRAVILSTAKDLARTNEILAALRMTVILASKLNRNEVENWYR